MVYAKIVVHHQGPGRKGFRGAEFRGFTGMRMKGDGGCIEKSIGVRGGGENPNFDLFKHFWITHRHTLQLFIVDLINLQQKKIGEEPSFKVWSKLGQ